MFNVGGGEIVVILLLALIVLGPDKLPNAARQIGKYMGEFRRVSSGFQQEFRDAMKVEGLTGGTPVSGGSGPTLPPRLDTAGDAAPADPDAANATEPPASSPAGSDAATASASEPPATATPPVLPPQPPVDVDGPSGSFS